MTFVYDGCIQRWTTIRLVGHREQLLAGAKKCLQERGYGRTTARDLVAASGTNLASIGYHFGSKEALLNAALIAALGDWEEELMSISRQFPGEGSWEDFGAAWTTVFGTLSRHRPLLVSYMEAMAQAQHSEEIRRAWADSYERARSEGAALLSRYTSDPKVTGMDEKSARAYISFHSAIMDGYMIQWLLDPENAPDGHDLATALRLVTSFIHEQ